MKSKNRNHISINSICYVIIPLLILTLFNAEISNSSVKENNNPLGTSLFAIGQFEYRNLITISNIIIAGAIIIIIILSIRLKGAESRYTKAIDDDIETLLKKSSDVVNGIYSNGNSDLKSKTDKFGGLFTNFNQITQQIKAKEEKNKELNKNIVTSYYETLNLLVGSLERRELNTSGHSRRVADYSVLLGEQLGFDEDKLKQLYFGALIHDIGKIGLPDNLINKDDKYTDDEYSIMKEHSLIGYEILIESNYSKEIIDIILYHHERWDGSGYPRGVYGKEIPLFARIVAIADAFDAMTSKRAYKDSLTIDHACKELMGNSSTQFDSDLVHCFISIDRKFISEIQENYN